MRDLFLVKLGRKGWQWQAASVPKITLFALFKLQAHYKNQTSEAWSLLLSSFQR